MKTIHWLKNNPIRSMFLIPIFLVAGISISHVVTWYDIANPLSWAIYLSIAIEIGAMTALIAATNKIKGGVWFMFGLVTFIQMIGNIFYCFKEIDINGDLFIAWVELTGPIWEFLGTEQTDVVGLKRWLAFLEGGLLPIISLTSLHFFVKYDTPEEEIIKEVKEEEILKEEKTNTEDKEEKELFFPSPKKKIDEINEDDVIINKKEIINVEETSDEIITNALKKYKESKLNNQPEPPKKVTNKIIVPQPKKNRSSIKRID